MQVGGGDDGVCQVHARPRSGDGPEESIWASSFSSDDAWYGEMMVTNVPHPDSVLMSRIQIKPKIGVEC